MATCSFSAFACRNLASLYLEPGPQRVGSKYKKVMFVEYEDGTFRKRKVSSQQDKGILGPVIKGEVGDQFKVRETQLSTVQYSELDAVPTDSSWLVADLSSSGALSCLAVFKIHWKGRCYL